MYFIELLNKLLVGFLLKRRGDEIIIEVEDMEGNLTYYKAGHIDPDMGPIVKASEGRMV